MSFKDLPSFLTALERAKELKRISVEVDPELEITEIATRVVKNEGPALLFEKVKGSSYPVVINIFLEAPGALNWRSASRPPELGEAKNWFGSAQSMQPPKLA